MLKNLPYKLFPASYFWQRGICLPMINAISAQKQICHNSDNYDDLSRQEDDVSEESEMIYFTGDTKKVEHLKKDPETNGLKPIRYSLAVTNKMLFGPLLETKVEKKKRLKREEKGITEEQYQEKQKKKKKGRKAKKNEAINNSLISMPENAHFQFLQNESSSHTSSNQEVIDDNKVNGNFNANDHPMLEIKKMPKHSFNSGKPIISSISSSKTKKIILIHSKEESEIITDTDDQENMNLTEYQKTDTSSESLRENNLSMLVTIDNSKFSAVPNVLDINEIKNFPLFSHRHPIPESSSKGEYFVNDITTIGMFDGGYQRLPSVRKILDETMPLPNKIALEKWKAKMIKELGEDGFIKYRQELLDRGKLLHGCIQSELSGASLTADQLQSISGFWTSVSHILPNVSDIRVLESRLIHPYLYYQGAVDCVGSYKGMPMLIEWKTSSKPKLSLKSMFDDPLQVAAYLGALNFDSNYKVKQHIDSAMLVVAYDTGLPAHIHILKQSDCEYYWRMWCTRLSQFWSQLAVPLPQ